MARAIWSLGRREFARLESATPPHTGSVRRGLALAHTGFAVLDRRNPDRTRPTNEQVRNARRGGGRGGEDRGQSAKKWPSCAAPSVTDFGRSPIATATPPPSARTAAQARSCAARPTGTGGSNASARLSARRWHAPSGEMTRRCVSPRTVARLRKQGRLRVSHIGRRVLVLRTDLDATGASRKLRVNPPRRGLQLGQ